MNLSASVILSVLLWMTAGFGEPEDVRAGRLWPIAVALEKEARSVSEVSRALAQSWGESRLKANVQFGACRSGTCDVDSRGRFRAHGPYQNHAIESRPDLVELWKQARSDAYAATILQLKVQRELLSCGGNVVHSFSAHDGKGCRDTARGRYRAELARKIEARIREELAR